MSDVSISNEPATAATSFPCGRPLCRRAAISAPRRPLGTGL